MKGIKTSTQKICGYKFYISCYPHFFANANKYALSVEALFTPQMWKAPIPPNDYKAKNWSPLLNVFNKLTQMSPMKSRTS